MYRAVVLSLLLYGADTWTLYTTQVKKLNAFLMRHLRAMMNMTWRDKITNMDILQEAGLPSMEEILLEKNPGSHISWPQNLYIFFRFRSLFGAITYSTNR